MGESRRHGKKTEETSLFRGRKRVRRLETRRISGVNLALVAGLAVGVVGVVARTTGAGGERRAIEITARRAGEILTESVGLGGRHDGSLSRRLSSRSLPRGRAGRRETAHLKVTEEPGMRNYGTEVLRTWCSLTELRSSEFPAYDASASPLFSPLSFPFRTLAPSALPRRPRLSHR